MPKIALYALASGLVLDRSALIEQPANEFQNTLTTVRQTPPNKLLVVVDDAEAFFNPKTLVAMLNHGDNRAQLINEHISFFTEAQMQELMKQNAAQGKQPAGDGNLIVDLGAGAGAKPADPAIMGYKYADVPEGWSVHSHMSLGATKVRRKIKSKEGDGTMFAVKPDNYQKLWNFAAAAWAGIPAAPAKMMIDTYQGKMSATVQDDRIAIGGNYIRRYEIEQVAKYRGWAIPKAA